MLLTEPTKKQYKKFEVLYENIDYVLHTLNPIIRAGRSIDDGNDRIILARRRLKRVESSFSRLRDGDLDPVHYKVVNDDLTLCKEVLGKAMFYVYAGKTPAANTAMQLQMMLSARLGIRWTELETMFPKFTKLRRLCEQSDFVDKSESDLYNEIDGIIERVTQLLEKEVA